MSLPLNNEGVRRVLEGCPTGPLTRTVTVLDDDCIRSVYPGREQIGVDWRARCIYMTDTAIFNDKMPGDQSFFQH